MSVIVEYPSEIHDYLIDSINGDSVHISLWGAKQQMIGRIEFYINILSEDNRPNFVSRGGWLVVRMPISLFSSVIELLRSGQKVSLSADGDFYTTYRGK